MVVITRTQRNKSRKHSHGIEIQSCDSIIIPLMVEDNRANFFTVTS